MKPNTDHITMNYKTQKFECKHCGQQFAPEFPCPIQKLVKQSEATVGERKTEVEGLRQKLTNLGTQVQADAPLLQRLDRFEQWVTAQRSRIENLRSKHADGKLGWPEHAPYDAIILTAADDAVAPELFAQLAPDGVLVAPVGRPGAQKLLRYRQVDAAAKSGWVGEALDAVSFVPLLGGLI